MDSDHPVNRYFKQSLGETDEEYIKWLKCRIFFYNSKHKYISDEDREIRIQYITSLLDSRVYKVMIPEEILNLII